MSRQVQWRRFAFFDKETVAEDVANELGAEVSCMHTSGGRLYLGEPGCGTAVFFGPWQRLLYWLGVVQQCCCRCCSCNRQTSSDRAG